MRILQINTVLNSGSTGRIAEESFIGYGRAARPSSSKSINIGNKADFLNHVFVSRFLDRHGFASKNPTERFVAYMDASVDIVHLHNIHGYYLHVGVMAEWLRRINKPVVWTFHDCWPITGHCSYFDRVGCEKWQTECNKCPLTRAYPESLFVDNSTRNFREKKALFSSIKNLTVVAPCNWMANIVKKTFLSDSPVIVINNGVDLVQFKPGMDISSIDDRYRLKSKKVLLGVASVWSLRKGLGDFIKLSLLLDTNYQIVLVGLSKSQLKKLPDHIIGIERTESIEELVALYNRADAFVNPTYIDNFPSTNIEALACGTPVVTYETGGSPEAIDKKTGRVIPKGDIHALKQAIEELLSVDTQSLAEGCRSRAIENFDADRQYDKYIALYKSLVKEQK